ncbi:uncharacterized protein ACIBXB_019352 isoform 1-T1 [Morphnus guianensis]
MLTVPDAGFAAKAQGFRMREDLRKDLSLLIGSRRKFSSPRFPYCRQTLAERRCSSDTDPGAAAASRGSASVESIGIAAGVGFL